MCVCIYINPVNKQRVAIQKLALMSLVALVIFHVCLYIHKPRQQTKDCHTKISFDVFGSFGYFSCVFVYINPVNKQRVAMRKLTVLSLVGLVYSHACLYIQTDKIVFDNWMVHLLVNSSESVQ